MKNIKVIGTADWVFTSNTSPLMDNLSNFEEIENLIIFCVDPNIDVTLRECSVKKSSVIKIDYSNSDPDYGVTRKVVANFPMVNGSRVYIDCTNLMVSLYSYIYTYIREVYNESSVSFIYFETVNYEDPQNYQFHVGSLNKIQLDCFTENNDNDRELVVYLTGFEGSLTEVIDREIEPAKKVIINGFPSFLLSYKDISLVKNLHLHVNNFSVDYCSASNPYHVYNKLLSIYEKYKGDYKITLALCGSTPTSIGAIMLASDIGDVKVVVARPEKYEHIKRVYRNMWIYSYES